MNNKDGVNKLQIAGSWFNVESIVIELLLVLTDSTPEELRFTELKTTYMK